MSASILLETADFHAFNVQEVMDGELSRGATADGPRPARSKASWTPNRRREWLAKPDARQLPLRFSEPDAVAGVSGAHVGTASLSIAALEGLGVQWAEEAVRAVLIIVVILGGMML